MNINVLWRKTYLLGSKIVRKKILMRIVTLLMLSVVTYPIFGMAQDAIASSPIIKAIELSTDKHTKISNELLKVDYESLIDSFLEWQGLSVVLFILLLGSLGIRLINNQRKTIKSIRLVGKNALNGLELKIAEQTAELFGINQTLAGEILAGKAVTTELLLSKEQLRAATERLSLHVQNTPLACISWDINFKCTEWNPLAEKIFGYSEIEALGLYGPDILTGGKVRKEVHRLYKLLLKQEGGVRSLNENITKNGRTIVCEWYNIALLDENGVVTGVASLVQDVTESKQLEEQLLTQSQIISNMEEGASLIRISDQKIVYTNRAFEDMFGYKNGEMLGQHVSIVDAPSDIALENNAKDIIKKLKANGVWRGEVHNIKKDRTTFWCSTTISNFDHPVYGKVWVSVHADISERKSMYEKLKHQASHDSLTGLIGRYEFEKRVTDLVVRYSSDQAGHAMCFLDLDQFKVINDTCGHAAGDELLRQLGRLLIETVRQQDTLARLGGDEFGVLIKHCTLEEAYLIANDILDAVMDHQFFWEGKTFRIGVSIGLIAIKEDTGNFTDLFKQADRACYLAKELGRNRIHVYHPDDIELAVRHGEMQWVGRIQRALDEDRFCLYAQPIMSLEREDLQHYELLVRMLGEENEIIPPGAFLPAAERFNLIEKVDTWVVKNAISIMNSNSAFIKEVNFISINLSGHSVANVQFMPMLIALLIESNIDASKICFEITETAAISNLSAANTFIAALKKLGCSFALDDFGSGLSSFGYLKNLPVDYLKIDGMFVKDMVDDPIDRAMVKSINDIGHVMGMRTIAEFVENDAIMGQLIEIGVDCAQGYGIGKPQPFNDVISQFNNN
jgi:diguanylate cyclase (GGDEF)-like protein/PAS domain S-box-containing protein